MFLSPQKSMVRLIIFYDIVIMEEHLYADKEFLQIFDRTAPKGRKKWLIILFKNAE